MKYWISRLVILACAGLIAMGVRAADASDVEVDEGYKATLTCYAASTLASEVDEEAVYWWAQTLFALELMYPEVRIHMAIAVVAIENFLNSGAENAQIDVDDAAESCGIIRDNLMSKESECKSYEIKVCDKVHDRCACQDRHRTMKDLKAAMGQPR